MGMLVTSISRIEQIEEEPKKYILLDNSIYWDDDGSLYLVPRNYKSDGYTIPNWIAWLGGGKMEYDLRPAHFHDFICQYHAAIKISKVNLTTLRKRRLIRSHYNQDTQHWLTIAEDIPVKYLDYVHFTKWEADCIFKRIMKSTKTIPAWRVGLMRFGVFFNINWCRSGKKDYDFSKCYKVQDDD